MSEQTTTEVFLRLLIDGVAKAAAKYFGLKQKPVLVLTNNTLQYLSQVEGLRSDAPGTAYPYTALKPQSVALDVQRGNPRAMQLDRRVQKQSGMDKDANAFNFVPASLQLQFMYVDNDPIRMLVFTNKWVAAVRRKPLNFGVKLADVIIDIQVTLEDSIEFPEFDMDTGSMQSQGIALGQLTVVGYIIEDIRKVEPIESVSFSSVEEDSTAHLDGAILLEVVIDPDGTVRYSPD